MHGARFLGVYVCVRAHAHTHVHSSWMEVRKRLSGVISRLSCWFRDPTQVASTVAMPLPTGPSCWLMSIFLLLIMLWVSWQTTVCLFMCVSVCTCLCGFVHVWIGVFAHVWVYICMNRCVRTCVGVGVYAEVRGH